MPYTCELTIEPHDQEDADKMSMPLEGYDLVIIYDYDVDEPVPGHKQAQYHPLEIKIVNEDGSEEDLPQGIADWFEDEIKEAMRNDMTAASSPWADPRVP